MPNRRLTQHGFTIVEMMVVLSIILILLGLLVLPLFEQAQRAGWSVTCASNLGQISKATLTWRDDHSSKRKKNLALSAYDWQFELLPYLSDQRNIFDCPETETAKSGGLENYYFLTFEGRESRTPLVPGPWVGKLSTTQIDAAMADGKLSGSRSADNWSVPVYVADGDPYTYWLVYENMQGPTDRDFKDVITKVEINGKKISMSFFRRGNNGGLIFLHDKAIPEVIDKTGPNIRVDWIDTTAEATFTTGRRTGLTQEGPSYEIDSNASAYGMNDAVLDIPLGNQKLLVMDYVTLRASAMLDNWADWTFAGSFAPSFARHPNERVNIAWLDGSVKSAWWGEYDPINFSTAQTYWLID